MVRLRLTDWGGLALVVEGAEAELVSRSRRLADSEAPDAATYRRANPEDPLPACILVAGAVPGELAGRWQAISAAGRDLDIAALVVTAAEPPPALAGAWVRLDGHGCVLQSHPAALVDELAGARLFRLDTAEAADPGGLGCRAGIPATPVDHLIITSAPRALDALCGGHRSRGGVGSRRRSKACCPPFGRAPVASLDRPIQLP